MIMVSSPGFWWVGGSHNDHGVLTWCLGGGSGP